MERTTAKKRTRREIVKSIKENVAKCKKFFKDRKLLQAEALLDVFWTKLVLVLMGREPPPLKVGEEEVSEEDVKDILTSKLIEDLKALEPHLKGEYDDLLHLAGMVYYQWKLSTAGYEALRNYYMYRAVEGSNLWDMWKILRELGKVFLSIWNDSAGFHWHVSEEKKKEPTYSFGEEVLWGLIGGDPTFTVAHKYGFASGHLRDLRDEATRWFSPEYDDVFAHKVENAIRRKLEKEVAGKLREELDQNPSVQIPIAGINAKTGRTDDGKYLIVIEATNESGRSIAERICSRYRDGEEASCEVEQNKYVISFSDFNEFNFAVGSLFIEVLDNLRRAFYEKMQNPTERFFFLRELHESGLLEEEKLYNEALEWITEVTHDDAKQVELWTSVDEFLRHFYEYQKEARGIHGEDVWDDFSRWMSLTEEILDKWGELERPPTKPEEYRQFEEDVKKYIVETEKMLSSLHGGGGALTKLTPTGQLADIFKLIALRSLILGPPILRRPAREGDKKLLLKWLFLAAVVLGKPKSSYL